MSLSMPKSRSTSIRNLAFFAGSLIALASCGTPVSNPDVPNGADVQSNSEAAVTDVPAAGEQTYTYVISNLTVDETPTDANSVQAGFNLDGIYTAEDGSTPFSCGKPDQPSDLDRDQNAPGAMVNAMTGRAPAANPGCAPGAGCRGGVDNQLPNIVDAIGTALSMQFPDGIRPVLRQQIQGNSISLVVRITGVNDLMNDESVQLKIYAAYPTFTTNCNTVAPDREYAISTASVMGGNIETPTIPAFNARIVAGRLLVSMPGQFPLPLPEIMGTQVNLTLTNAQLRLNLTEAAGTRGNLGGMFNGSQLLDIIQRAAPTFVMQAAGIIGGFVDIQEPVPTEGTMMQGLCVDRMNPMMPRFGNIGVGLRFETVRATVAAMPAAARPAGACGASAATDAGRPNG